MNAREIRFTRAGQATPLWLGAAVGLTAAAAMFLMGWATGNAVVDRLSGWAVLPAALAGILVKLAIHCTRHAYLILTPLGIEVIPLFRPAARMQLVAWGQIDSLDCSDSRLTLHFNREKSSGVHLSLRPLRHDQRVLLKTALAGRLVSATSSNC